MAIKIILTIQKLMHTYEKVKTICHVIKQELMQICEKIKTIFYQVYSTNCEQKLIKEQLLASTYVSEKVKQESQKLTKEQLLALNYVSKKAKQESQKMLDKNNKLMLRAKKLKISETNLLKTLEYIRDKIPLVIHVTLNILKLLINDTHYRNQFETHRSGGSLDYTARRRWENAMFNKAYDNVIPFERCKYGCINTNHNNRPVSFTQQYGENYLILKNNSEIRFRTTCWYGDTCGFKSNNSLGTLENFAHILVNFSCGELKNIVSLACGIDSYTEESDVNYKEIQIHGPINLDTDIETLVLDNKYKENHEVTELANKFKFKFSGIKVIYSD